MSKRIILMYISDISGHRSAALAIERALKQLDPSCQTKGINTFHYTNPVSEKIINRLYMGVISKTPKLWDYLYDNPQVLKRVSRIKRSIHRLNSPKLKNLFDEFKPDAVVCTQAFPCGMVADYKEFSGSSLPLVAVMTDYVPHSYWIYDKVDYYVVPSRQVKERLAEKGVASDKILELGIPFDLRFNQQLDKDKLMQELGLKRDKPVILIMGGGQGLGPMKSVLMALQAMKRDLQQIVVCGSNQALYDSLKAKEKKFKKKVLFFAYADNVNELMGVADLIVTKPGGITSAEALARHLPMIIIKPLPGQEVSNTNYLVENGSAVKAQSSEELVSVVEELLDDPQKRRLYSEAARRISKPQASLEIARLLLRLSNV